LIYLDTSVALAHLIGEDRLLHLASVEFLRGQNQAVRLASYDRRMLETADRMAIPLFDLP